jgi:streptogramin lyase
VRSRAGICLTGALLALALASPARALSPTVTEFSSAFSSADDLLGIASGPDGNLWFADALAGGALGRITTSGDTVKFSSGLGPGSSPQHVTAGPDGNVWFSDGSAGAPAIGRVTGGGQIDEFSLPAGSAPAGIALGPDGNLWFADQGTTPAIGRITPAGAIHEFTGPGLNAGASPQDIAAGADGNLWFTDRGTTAAIGRITPEGAIQEFTSGLRAGSTPESITAGPDGNLWFTDQGTTAAIGRITPAGAISEFTSGLDAGAQPEGITPAADGALWFADSGSPAAIGRVFTDGGITELTAGLPLGSRPFGISSGPDGNVWFTDNSGTQPAIGMITTPPTAFTVAATATSATTAAILGLVDGHSQPSTFHVEYGQAGGSLSSTRGHNLGTTSGPTRVTAALTHLRPNTSYQARVLGVNPTETTAGDFVTFTTGPPADHITRMRLRPRVFVAASRGGSVRSARAPGALITYRGSQPATTTFTIERAVLGRRSGRNCVKRNHRNRRRKTCILYRKVGSFKHHDPVGRVRFRFTGRLHHRSLHPGRYRLTAEPHSAGGIGHLVRKHFSVKAAPRRHHRKRSRT